MRDVLSRFSMNWTAPIYKSDMSDAFMMVISRGYEPRTIYSSPLRRQVYLGGGNAECIVSLTRDALGLLGARRK